MALKPTHAFVLIALFTIMGWGQIAPQHLKPFLFSMSLEEIRQMALSDVNIGGAISPTEITPSEIRFWNAAYASYRWHQIMVKAGHRHEGRKNGGRMAVLHLAIYDALASLDKNNVVDLDERSVVAGTAHAIIGNYFPKQQKWLDSTLKSYRTAQISVTENDVQAIESSIRYGMLMAQKHLEYAKTNNTDKIWTGSIPNDPKLWSGTPYKYGPTKREWRPITLNSASQFRPEPPPEDWSVDMKELRDFYKKNKRSAIAWKWKSEPIWDYLLERKILEYGLDTAEAAYVSAVFHAARYDATIAAWDGKYHYWGIRPFQYDRLFQPILETPNFPGYPAGHTTVAGALAKVLSYFFPHDTKQFEKLALECSESRFEGGVHFRTDNEVGLEVGRKVGRHVINTFKNRTGKH